MAGTEARARPDIVLLPLDGDTVAFSEEAQTLVRLNMTAALVLHGLIEGAGRAATIASLADAARIPRDEAARWCDRGLEVLAAHGLVAIADADFVVQPRADEPPNRTLERVPPYVPGAVVAERRYRLLDTVLAVRLSSSEQIPWIDAVIGHLAADAAPTVTVDVQGPRLGDGRVRCFVYKEGEPEGLARGLDGLGPVVKSTLWNAAIDASDFFLYLHAGAVGAARGALLLPAAAGSGKSSLTAALAHDGYDYLSDEVALLMSDTLVVPPVPLALCAKDTGWHVIAPFVPHLETLPVHRRGDGKTVRYVSPASFAKVAERSLPVSHVVFPRYRADVETRLDPVARIEAMSRLMEECLALRKRLDRRNVAAFMDWMRGVACYELTFSSLERAVTLLKSVAAVPR